MSHSDGSQKITRLRIHQALSSPMRARKAMEELIRLALAEMPKRKGFRT